MARARFLVSAVLASFVAAKPPRVISTDYSNGDWDTAYQTDIYLDPRYNPAFGFSAPPAEWAPATMECNLGELPLDFFAPAQDQIEIGVPVARSYFFSKHGCVSTTSWDDVPSPFLSLFERAHLSLAHSSSVSSLSGWCSKFPGTSP
jgi:hypothetical protein